MCSTCRERLDKISAVPSDVGSSPRPRSRIGQHLPWVATQQISTHWLRHTTLTWVERHFGYAIARAYAGHTRNSDAGSTTTYIRADLHEVATALAALTREPHPLTEDGESTILHHIV